MSEQDQNGNTSDINPQNSKRVQRTWHLADGDIPIATDWMVSERWRFLVNRLRVPASTADEAKHRKGDSTLLAEMNSGEQPKKLRPS